MVVNMKKFKKVLEVFNIVYDVVVRLLKLALIIVMCICLKKCYVDIPQDIKRLLSIKMLSSKDITEAKSIVVKDGIFADKVEYPVIHSTEKPYSCDFMVLQENLDLSGEELENKINEICYEEQQNTTFPMS